MAGSEIRVGDGSIRRSPNIPNRDKSVHSRGSGNSPYVRYRHPEFHALAADNSERNSEPGTSLDNIDEPVLDATCHYPNTRIHVVDDFGRVVEPPAYSNGDATGLSYSRKQTKHVVTNDDPTGDPVFTWESSPTLVHVASTVGMGDYDAGIPPTINGWHESEAWFQSGVMPSHPADMAGIKCTFTTFNPQGVSGTYGAKVYVRDAQPTAMRQGTFVGTIALGTGGQTVFIPGHLIPAAGQVLYIGLQPNWQANYGEPVRAFQWPWVTGAENSGRCQVGVGAITASVWQIWDASEQDWGRTLHDDLSCFDGDLKWEHSEGSGGVLEMDGSSLVFTAATNAWAILSVRGAAGQSIDDDDDDSQNGEGPWDNVLGTTLYSRFRITTAGDVTDSGERRYSMEYMSPTRLVRVSAHLGDGAYAEGVSLSIDGADPTFVAKTITEGSIMCLRVDSRHGDWVRAKMWLEAGPLLGGEPVAWDIEINHEQDDDEAEVVVDTSDRHLDLQLFAGNDSGDSQVIEVLGVYAACPVDPCEWVEERLGEFDAKVTVATTSMPYEDGSLWFFLDGFYVQTRPVDSDRGTFSWAAPNALNAVAVVRYQRAGDF